ncbi:acyl-CoA N-acyltransferase [Dendryphion nanum]|uniref:Acyl-CoA N-acyltransferase n=1 Tax=Dendryphion nanum TaxID=256645 RepID=A0A9P9E6X5_9PLEO|nr:acyl-CoA N-acyltransferase [Dendryphion nanum]
MPLEVHPVTESDFKDFVDIQYGAFSGGMASKLNPPPITPEHLQKSIEKHIKNAQDEPDLHFMKVIDTDLNGKMIAGAKWRINHEERTEEQVRLVQIPTPGPEYEGNQAAKDFLKFLAHVRTTWMGTKPFYFLHLLVTRPDHQRRGAGTLLLNWGLEQSDKAQIPAFLESTREGLQVYEKVGFKPVEEQTFDLSKYGGTGWDSSTAMIREPAS